MCDGDRQLVEVVTGCYSGILAGDSLFSHFYWQNNRSATLCLSEDAAWGRGRA